MGRGILTEQMKEMYGIESVKELRLIPYFQYLLVNHMSVDVSKIDSEEREILKKWRDEGKITFSCSEPVTATKKFWDWANDILWVSYVPQLHTENEWQEKYWDNDGQPYRDLSREDDGTPSKNIRRYVIVFDVEKRYYCFVDAINMNEALGIFFKNHDTVRYSNIFVHQEI